MDWNSDDEDQRLGALTEGDKAAKVYTVNDESRYLVVRNVPALGCIPDLVSLFALYGEIEEYKMLDEDDAAGPEKDVVWIKFRLVENARFAKRKLQNHLFFASELEVSYRPEDETVEDTLTKLEERRCTVAKRRARLAVEGVEANRTQDPSAKMRQQSDGAHEHPTIRPGIHLEGHQGPRKGRGVPQGVSLTQGRGGAEQHASRWEDKKRKESQFGAEDGRQGKRPSSGTQTTPGSYGSMMHRWHHAKKK